MEDVARRAEEQSTLRRAQILNLQYVDTSQGEKKLYPEVLSNQDLYTYKAIPLYVDAHNIHFGVVNNTSQKTMSSLRQRFLDQRVSFSLISDSGFKDYMLKYDPPAKIEYKDISIADTGSRQLTESISKILSEVRADDMLAYLVQQAHRLAASDIHLETQKKYTRIRFRIDGVLHTIANLQPDKYRILISAIASAGNISTAETAAQQGHISQAVTMADESRVQVNLRLETVMTVNGIDVVMRLFNMDQESYKLERLGLSEQERAVVDDIIAKPTGLAMVVGPTGSGKTTTLYSMLNTLNTEGRKIITIEDPVEYQLEGISQIPINSKASDDSHFANSLRAILRLDPDVVMVGEVRDMDTAKTALQASLTGHLVLTTFHASSASAALARLMDVIDQNPLFVSAIRLVMAQRLVRKLDPSTKQPYEPTEAELATLRQVLDSMPENAHKPSLEGLQLYKPGSSDENPYGFSGQIALREQFLMTGKIREILEDGIANSAHDIEAAAIESGMQTMLQDGVIKVIAGETTLEEIYRVIG